MIDFNDGKLIPFGREIFTEISINNVGEHKIKYKLNAGIISTKKYEFSITPKEGVVKKVTIFPESSTLRKFQENFRDDSDWIDD